MCDGTNWCLGTEHKTQASVSNDNPSYNDLRDFCFSGFEVCEVFLISGIIIKKILFNIWYF